MEVNRVNGPDNREGKGGRGGGDGGRTGPVARTKRSGVERSEKVRASVEWMCGWSVPMCREAERTKQKKEQWSRGVTAVLTGSAFFFLALRLRPTDARNSTKRASVRLSV